MVKDAASPTAISGRIYFGKDHALPGRPPPHEKGRVPGLAFARRAVGYIDACRRAERVRKSRGPTLYGRMDLGLRDSVYLVTGGSRGLGFAAAQALVADGPACCSVHRMRPRPRPPRPASRSP